MNKKGFLQISFPWLFALIVGAVILFIAIFALTKFIKTEQQTQDVKAAKELGILLNPLEISFEEGKITTFQMPLESRIYFDCDLNGNFGNQYIMAKEKIKNTWSDTDVEVSFENKYIFSSEYVEGKTFYVFSKPFYFPFKVASLMYITSSEDKYCFVEPPYEIKEEISNLNPQNIFLENCPENSVRICFNGEECNISVDYDNGEVRKGEDVFYFNEDALMYAAIFSDSKAYECQVKRLIQKRAYSLAKIYKQKSFNYNTGFCGDDMLLSSLDYFIIALESFDYPNSFNSMLFQSVNDIELENKYTSCKLW